MIEEKPDEYTEEIKLTDEEIEDLDSVESDAKPIAYSGQDFDVDGLIRRLKNRDILIPNFGHEDRDIESAGFQRAFVWRRPQMDKFIESILLGYPIPGVILVKQTDKRYLVLDGQQRLQTLKYFQEGLYQGREFVLNNVSNEFSGLTYKTLPDDLRRVFDNTFIQAIIVSSDGSTESLDAIYQIFERLNSGGTQLTAHEIRVALYAGPFIDFLEALNKSESWRSLYGGKSPRLRDQELILRVLGLYWHSDIYKRPLKKFLNDVVSTHREEGQHQHSDLKSSFELATKLILDGHGKNALSVSGRQVNAALAEVILEGLVRRLIKKSDDIPSEEAVAEAIKKIKGNRDIVEAVSKSTADEAQVEKRIRLARAAFSEI